MEAKFYYLLDTGRLFLPYLTKDKYNRLRAFFALLLVILDISVTSALPFLGKFLVEYVSNPHTINVIIVVMVCGLIWLIDRTVDYILEIVFFPVVNNTIMDITLRVINHIHQIAFSDYQKLSIPEVISCIKRISLSVRVFLRTTLFILLPNLIKLIISVIVILKLKIIGTLFLLSMLVLFGIVYIFLIFYLKARELSWFITDQVTISLNDSILNTKIVRFNQDFENNYLSNILKKEAFYWNKTNIRLNLIHIVMGIILTLTTVIIIYSAINMVEAKMLTLGNFVLLQGQIAIVFMLTKNFIMEIRQISESAVDIKRIINIFAIPKAEVSSADIVKSDAIISFENVSYGFYDNLIFTNMNWQIKAGDKVAIIGETGSGKSTLASLLSGYIQPSEGKITVAGINLKDLDFKRLSPFFAIIPQDVQYFNQTLYFNLTYGIDKVDKDHLNELIEQIGLKSLVDGLPMGLDTKVGDMALRLSGGERQKIALIRTLLNTPQILVLDETTNALHITQETEIISYLIKVVSTIIFISHRKENINLFDHIYEVKQGKLVLLKSAF